MELYDQITKKSQCKHNELHVNLNGKKIPRGEREREENSTIIMVITLGISGVLGFLEFESDPRWKRSSIYTDYVCLDKAAEYSTLFKHLTTYLGGS